MEPDAVVADPIDACVFLLFDLPHHGIAAHRTGRLSVWHQQSTEIAFTPMLMFDLRRRSPEAIGMYMNGFMHYTSIT